MPVQIWIAEKEPCSQTQSENEGTENSFKINMHFDRDISSSGYQSWPE